MKIISALLTSAKSKSLLIKKMTCKALALFALFISLNSTALESSISVHKGDESKTTGFSLSITDDFSRKNNLYWTLSYNKLNDVNVDWNERALYFSVDTLDALVTYQHTPNSYNQFIKSLTFEYHAGVSIALTENKFTWPELNEERLFSEKGDINAVLAFAVKYKFSKKTSVNLGLKYQPSFSEFGSVASIYLGLSYKFGSEYGY